MGKLVFLHYLKYTREFLKSPREIMLAEADRYANLLKKHGLKLLSWGGPWGNEYTGLYILESEKGIDAWDAFTTELFANGTPDAWKFIAESRTEIMSPN